MMLLRLVFVVLVTNLLGLAMAQDGNMTDGPPVPSTDGGGNGTNSMSCMMPMDMFNEDPSKSDMVLKWINQMRNMREKIHPKNMGACPGGELSMTDALMASASMSAMMCPMPSAPMMPTFMDKGDHGETVIYNMRMGDKMDDLMDEMAWKKAVMEMDDEQFKETVTSYKMGPWDPIFQMMWEETMHVGCGLVMYNNSDLEQMSKMFGHPVTETMEMHVLVCHWAPAGCKAGMETWKFCGFHTTEMMTTDDHSDMTDPDVPTSSPDDTDPTQTAQPITKAPATRVCVRVGFNLEALALITALILTV